MLPATAAATSTVRPCSSCYVWYSNLQDIPAQHLAMMMGDGFTFVLCFFVVVVVVAPPSMASLSERNERALG